MVATPPASVVAMSEAAVAAVTSEVVEAAWVVAARWVEPPLPCYLAAQRQHALPSSCAAVQCVCAQCHCRDQPSVAARRWQPQRLWAEAREAEGVRASRHLQLVGVVQQVSSRRLAVAPAHHSRH